MREHRIDQTSTYIRTDENMNECDQTGIYIRIDESMNERKILHRTWHTRENFRHVNWEGKLFHCHLDTHFLTFRTRPGV
jgi:hypothetical protein